AETVISHVDRRGGFVSRDLWAVQDARGIPVEVHGSPFRTFSDLQVVEALRPLGGASQDITYYPRPPGGWVEGNPWRLVLHFNPQGAPNSVQDCQRVAEARTNTPSEGRFDVNASFCHEGEWRAQGYLQVARIEDGDLEAFGDTIAQLMMVIFREEPD